MSRLLMLSCVAGSATLITGAVVSVAQDDAALPIRTAAAMRQATQFFHGQVAVNGGYVYRYSLDLTSREGEGKAAPTEIWVQPPGTPSVGVACIRAWEATGDQIFLNAAVDAARALVYGQLESGAWSASIDFDPQGKNADRYRNGKGRAKGRNYSTLDDDKSQSAMRLLMEVDRVLKFADPEIHEASLIALRALLSAQFANGGFPQGWKAPATPQPILKASFPDYDWRTENRIKDYWDYYTLNDGLAGDVFATLKLAEEVYGDPVYRQAMLKLGDFLILAQMPEPQPAWAQQYNFQMHPMWARKFEPPAVVGSESVDVIETLMQLSELTGDRKYLAPIPAALDWLKRSRLSDGRTARFYELRTNRPLYLTKDTYELTFDDSSLPTHYGFKSELKTQRLEQQYQEVVTTGRLKKSSSNLKTLTRDAERIIAELDREGRWVTDKSGKFQTADAESAAGKFLLSEVFSKNLTRLGEYLLAAKLSGN